MVGQDWRTAGAGAAILGTALLSCLAPARGVLPAAAPEPVLAAPMAAPRSFSRKLLQQDRAVPDNRRSEDCDETAFPAQRCGPCGAGQFSPQPGVSTIPVGGLSPGQHQPVGIAVSHDNASVFVVSRSDSGYAQHCEYIQEVDVLTWQVRALAGRCSYYSSGADGYGTNAGFKTPAGIATVPGSTKVLVADSGNHKIRFIDTVTQLVQTLAGSGSAGQQDGVGTDATFNTPMDVAVSANGSFALVAESALIRRVELMPFGKYAHAADISGTTCQSSLHGRYSYLQEWDGRPA